MAHSDLSGILPIRCQALVCSGIWLHQCPGFSFPIQCRAQISPKFLSQFIQDYDYGPFRFCPGFCLSVVNRTFVQKIIHIYVREFYCGNVSELNNINVREYDCTNIRDSHLPSNAERKPAQGSCPDLVRNFDYDPFQSSPVQDSHFSSNAEHRPTQGSCPDFVRDFDHDPFRICPES